MHSSEEAHVQKRGDTMDTPRKQRQPDPERQQLILTRNRQTHGMVLAAMLLFLVLLFGLINLLRPKSTFSENENRKLSAYPKPTLASIADGSFMSSLESAFSDQFFGRDRWIESKLRMDTFLGRRESNGVYLCDDRYLMEIPSAPDPAVLGKTLNAMNNFAVRHNDLNISAMIVPNASYVMRDYLPKNAPAHSQQEDLFSIEQTLSPYMQFIDVTQALKNHVRDGVFYRTDHHWTSLGACFAFEAAAEKLGIATPLTDYSIHILANDFEGTLASKSGRHGVTDTVTAYEALGSDVSYYVIYDSAQEKAGSMFVSSALDAKDKYTVFFGGNHPLVTLKTTANTGKVLLLFKDSYANCFVQFLIPYYDQIVMVDPRYYYDNADQLITQRAVTDVLFLYNNSTFIADTALSDTLNAGLRSAE